MSIVALWGGRCGVCDEPFDEGDQIATVDGEWCHAACAEEEGEG